jgi:quercetin dioxygenase-like cupin family protein
MTERYGKVWGTTSPIETNGFVEFHRIETKKGGECSIHRHNFKYNGFYVESGKLLIKVWQKDYDLVDETILGPGDYMKVKPGVTHQFVCLEDTIAFELYWPEMLVNDIKRDSVGSYKKDEMLLG